MGEVIALKKIKCDRLVFITFVNDLFVFFAESTDNFVSCKSLLCFPLKLIYSDTFGNY